MIALSYRIQYKSASKPTRAIPSATKKKLCGVTALTSIKMSVSNAKRWQRPGFARRNSAITETPVAEIKCLAYYLFHICDPNIVPLKNEC